MKALSHLFTAGLLAIAGSLYAQNADEKPYLTKSFSTDGFKNLKVETSGGNVTVIGKNGGEASIEMYVRSSNSKNDLSQEEIKKRLENYVVNVNKDANTLTATAKRTGDGNWKDGLSISFKVYVPTAVTADLKTSGGNVTLTNLDGTQKAVTSGGNIDLNNMKGNVHVRTSGGNIDIETFSGTLDAVTSGGNIKADQAKGAMKLHTSGGNIRLATVSGSLDAKTSGGNIGAEITELGERLSLATSAGNVTVKMPLNKGMDLDLKGSKVNVTMNNFSGLIEDDRVQGKLNGGGIPVHITTSVGHLRIN